jgi:glycosyltransferase involved in cell wall biosynthesis
MSAPDRLRILHLIMRLAPGSGPYNEHCLPFIHKRRITICSFFKAELMPPAATEVFQGDGTVRGYRAALAAALDAGPYHVVHAHAPVCGIFLIALSLLRRRSMGNAVYSVLNSYRSYGLRNRLLLYPIVAFFPSIVVCSTAVLASLPRLVRWLGRTKISVVPNGVDIGGVDRALAGHVVENGGFRVVSVARLIDRKDPLTSMAAFARGADDDGSLVYVGEGYLRSRLAEQARRLGVADRVSFTGLLSRDEAYRWVARSDVFVSASHGEGLPVAVLEAMACGRPVILSDIPPHREIAGTADFIPLVSTGDVDGFAREIHRLGRMSPEARGDLGTRCKKLVEERYSLSAMHRSLESIYRERRADRPARKQPRL